MKLHYAFFCLLVTGCSSFGYQRMESAESRFNKSQSKMLCAYMSIDTMFPNEKLKSLAIAAGKGRLHRIDELVAAGIDPSSKGTRNCSILFWAMRDKDGFEKLLNLGADPNILFDDGGTVMHWAVRHEDSEFLTLLLKNGGNPNLRAGQLEETPLFLAVSPRNKDKLRYLIEAGADLDTKNSNGDTALIVAAGRGQYDVAMKLLDAGADYTLQNNRGRTLADTISWRSATMDPRNELTTWMHKVVNWLQDRGVSVELQEPKAESPNRVRADL
ncbi:MAG: hypothetical protein DBP02_13740 [gamma proteobacterium symbiont of Ctena orbiculata]|nr:MAG: hypothetical protein DBP02_13740 [gamma proteobacterium symbiont of Ctena orbiculata]